MTNFVAIDNVAHAQIKIERRYSREYGDSPNQLRVFVSEFEELQSEYPIFFRQVAENEFHAVTLLGLDADENLYLNDPDWDARYVPAVAQRGPFQIGVPENGEPILKVDLEDPRVSEDNGLPLFEANGGMSNYLNHILAVMQKIHIGLERNDAFFAKLQEYDLLEPVNLDLKLSDSVSYSVPNLFSIKEEAFYALKGAALEEFHASGLLGLCHYVLSSRRNVNELLNRKLLKTQS